VRQEASDRLRAADRHDRDALSVEVAASALGERFECARVARPFDEYDRPGQWQFVEPVSMNVLPASGTICQS
jgi:hypothetical protein